jgi:adenylate cyclase
MTVPASDWPSETDPSSGRSRRGTPRLVVAASIVALALPVVGLISLLFRSSLDPMWTSARLHFTLFLSVGTGAFILAYVAGQAADRRGDARVFLLSLGFLVTGGFLAIHAIASPGVLLNHELPGFGVAIPVGLAIAAIFSCTSAFVDVKPGLARRVMQQKNLLRISVLAAMALWAVWSFAQLPPLDSSSPEGGGVWLRTFAAIGAATYVISAVRYAYIYRARMTLLPLSVVACFLLLGEAMFGSALVGERTWHASWWEWHSLIVSAYLIVLFAARRQWRDERFQQLYLSRTRERSEDVSVLFADLSSYTTFAEQSPPPEITSMLRAYYGLATPLISKDFGGEVEKFMGDAIMATFNSRGDQPDHAVRAARAGLELQRRMGLLAVQHPEWPKVRVGINTGDALVREMGGPGYITYAVVGDTINLGSRLESLAPLGGVLIGDETYRRLPVDADVEARPALTIKGKQAPVDAYVLRALPSAKKRRVDPLRPAEQNGTPIVDHLRPRSHDHVH